MRLRLLLMTMTTVLAGVLTGVTPVQAVIGDGGAHPYVGVVSSGCTGSAVSRRVVITAAHCGADGARTNFYFDVDGSGFIGDTVKPGFDGVVGGTTHQYPGYCTGCGNGLPGFAAPDLAVIVLDQPITLPRYAQLPPAGLVDTLKNPAVTYVGYGADGIAHLPGTGTPTLTFEASFVRQTATGQVITDQARLSSDFVPLSSKQQVRLCFGDSGSPILRGDTAIAVMSIVNGSYCSSTSYAFRIDSPATLTFIRSFL
jgi:hypothetical protein